MAAPGIKPNSTERRYLDLAELRVDKPEADGKSIKGYAARFDRWSELIWGMFREKISKGAFDKSLKEADVRALVNHDPNYVLGRNKAQTLRLWEDDKGLAIDIDLPDTTWANDLTVSMERGDINQMSFAFQTVKDEWNAAGDERTLLEVKLHDVSVVTYPAYKSTSAKVRGTAEIFDEYCAGYFTFLRSSNGTPIGAQPPIEPVNDNHSAGHSEPDPIHSVNLRMKLLKLKHDHPTMRR